MLVKVKKIPDGLKEGIHTVYSRVLIQNQACQIKNVLKAILQLPGRFSWDPYLLNVAQLGLTVNCNMTIFEEEIDQRIGGKPMGHCVLKQCFFGDDSRFFIYRSSVPDNVYT